MAQAATLALLHALSSHLIFWSETEEEHKEMTHLLPTLNNPFTLRVLSDHQFNLRKFSFMSTSL